MKEKEVVKLKPSEVFGKNFTKLVEEEFKRKEMLSKQEPPKDKEEEKRKLPSKYSEIRAAIRDNMIRKRRERRYIR